jgi:predicted dehydrogenase
MKLRNSGGYIEAVMTRPKIGILGLGSIGSRHKANFEALGCEVVGYDPILTGYSSFNDVLACDAMVIASPTDMHFKHIMVCEKNLLVEKPLVMTRKEWEEVPLHHIRLVGYNLRFHSCVKKVRQWLAKGTIGKPLWARFTCAQYNDREAYRRDGVVLNWSHEIDLALHLLGKAEVQGAALTDGESLADILLRHEHNGCHTVIHLDYLTQPERRGFVIIGTHGSIDADLVNRQAFMKDNDGRLIHNHFGEDTFDSNYLTEAEAFLALIENKIMPQHLIGCTAKQAHDVVDICLEVKEFHE